MMQLYKCSTTIILFAEDVHSIPLQALVPLLESRYQCAESEFGFMILINNRLLKDLTLPIHPSDGTNNNT